MSSSNNAMTEIALALAMGFFSIMVVAMVSLGAGDGAAGSGRPEPLTVRLVSAAPDPGRPDAAEDASETELVVYHDGAFLDAELAPIDPAAVRSGAGKRVILALPPDLPMAEALRARQALTNAVPIVAALTQDWMTALEERRHDP